MDTATLTVREMKAVDIPLIISYWMGLDSSQLSAMGVDREKLPTKAQFSSYLSHQLQLPVHEKEAYCIIWEQDGTPVGHSNTRPTHYGNDAFMHLHLWYPGKRSRGMGLAFVQMTVPLYFQNLQLKTLYCEPYALNPAPNKTIEKAGFKLLEEKTSVPGAFNFEQSTKLWRLTKDQFQVLYPHSAAN